MDKKKLTHTEVAKKTGFQRQQITAYANGKTMPKADALEKIAKALGVSADYLLGLSDDEKPNRIMLRTYGDAARLLGFLSLSLDCLLHASYGYSPLNYGLDEEDMKEIGDSEDFHCFISLVSDDKTLFDYFKAVDKTVEALASVSDDTKKHLVDMFRSKLLEELDQKTLPSPTSLVLDGGISNAQP